MIRHDISFSSIFGGLIHRQLGWRCMDDHILDRLPHHDAARTEAITTGHDAEYLLRPFDGAVCYSKCGRPCFDFRLLHRTVGQQFKEESLASPSLPPRPFDRTSRSSAV